MNPTSNLTTTHGRTRRSAILAGGMGLLAALLLVIPDGDREVSRIDLGTLFKDSPVNFFATPDGFVEGNVVWHGDTYSVKFRRFASAAAVRREMINVRGAAPAQAIGEQAAYSIVFTGTKGAELWFRRYNVQVCVLKPGHLMGAVTPELDQLEVEAVAKRLDDAMLHGGEGVTVGNTSLAMGAMEALNYAQIPGMIGMYLEMGAVPLEIAVVPALLLLLGAQRIRHAPVRLAAASGSLAFFLAPGVAAGHGGIYVGPGYFMILSDPMMWLSVLVTWAVFLGTAAGARWWWTGKVK